jgi:hypothetical protein
MTNTFALGAACGAVMDGQTNSPTDPYIYTHMCELLNNVKC